MARILIACFGSLGDLHPYLAIGAELRRRGHRVTIATSQVYRPRVEAEGLGFHPVRPNITLHDKDMLTQAFDRRRGSERVVRFMCEAARDSYADSLAAVEQADLVVTHTLTWGAVLAVEKLHKPWVSTVLAPVSFLSVTDPPVPAQAPWLIKGRVLGDWFMRTIWGIGRRQILGWMKPLLDLRREIGLPPGGHPLFEGANSPDLVLALWARCFADPQPEWPAQAVITGFPFFDRGEISAELQQFFKEGPAPVVFTLGSSAVSVAGDFYPQSLAAVERLGCRAVFLTGPERQGLPAVLPKGMIAVDYAPHEAVFPRVAAIVHQGGVGTTGQALRAGRPMLVVPFAHDQFDNGERVRRLGCGEVVYKERYSSRRVEKCLSLLLSQPAYAKAAAKVGEKVRAENGSAASADAIERYLTGL